MEEHTRTANTWFRWNLLFALLVFVSFTLPVWLPMLIHAYAEGSQTVKPVYQHLVGVCLYKEPLNLLEQTIDSVAMQPNCAQSISFVAGLEQGTPDREQKTRELMDKYENKFHRFIVTAHPSEVPGEIPGKCSNLNYSISKAVRLLEIDETFNFDLQNILFTTADCDTVFPMHYFDVLANDYHTLDSKQRHHSVWQSPLFYQINLHKSWFFVRMTGLLRSVLMMGALIPWSINSMSIFSLSLKLYKLGGCTHPGYQMDDMIALIRWMLNTKQACQIRLLPLPTLSGPTSGDGFCEELYEWSRQIRRWTIGAGEVFHYFVVKSPRLPKLTAFAWAGKFTLYYGFLLCVAPLFSVTAAIGSFEMLKSKLSSSDLIPNDFDFNLILLGFTGLQYFWFLMVIVLNYAVNPLFPEQYRDQTGIFRNVLHWVLSMPTLLGYCIIELVAFMDLTVRGKVVCSHKPSRKDALIESAIPVPDYATFERAALHNHSAESEPLIGNA